MSLAELAALLEDYGTGAIALEAVHARLIPVLSADPLDVEASDSTPWDRAPADARLFWRLIYLFESEQTDGDEPRTRARRIVSCLRSTRSSAVTFELLPLILDQDRLNTIVERHLAGIISRTGFLSVIAESGYPSHVKLWLQHASAEALVRLTASLMAERYGAVAEALDAAP